MTPRELREVGLSWQSEGYPVLPVIFKPKENGGGTDKIPIVHYQHWKDGAAIQTEADVRAMPWERAEGVAILLWPTTDRIIVDGDGAGADALLSEAGIELPDTGIIWTPKGKHRHYLARPGTPRPTLNVADQDRREGRR